MNPTELKRAITLAFSHIEFPGNWCLRDSFEGDEPALLEEEFQNKDNWQILDADFLDQSPAGDSSALSFFSIEAFRFYLPAYLIADIDGLLKNVNPVFHLTHGLRDGDRTKIMNPRRYGLRTFFDSAIHQFSVFEPLQVAAIISYLLFKKESNYIDDLSIDQAINNYWNYRM